MGWKEMATELYRRSVTSRPDTLESRLGHDLADILLTPEQMDAIRLEELTKIGRGIGLQIPDKSKK
jgi:hypothetical protein